MSCVTPSFATQLSSERAHRACPTAGRRRTPDRRRWRRDGCEGHAGCRRRRRRVRRARLPRRADRSMHRRHPAPACGRGTAARSESRSLTLRSTQPRVRWQHGHRDPPMPPRPSPPRDAFSFIGRSEPLNRPRVRLPPRAVVSTRTSAQHGLSGLHSTMPCSASTPATASRCRLADPAPRLPEPSGSKQLPRRRRYAKTPSQTTVPGAWTILYTRSIPRWPSLAQAPPC